MVMKLILTLWLIISPVSASTTTFGENNDYNDWIACKIGEAISGISSCREPDWFANR
jgi:hypothetical protein